MFYQNSRPEADQAVAAFIEKYQEIDPSAVLKFGLYFFVWTGAMAGAWLSFGVRKISLSFEELSIIEKDLVSPTLRLIFVGIASLGSMSSGV